MQISRLELSLLRLSDGIASSADLERLSEHFEEEQLNAWRNVSRVVAHCIQLPNGTTIDVSEAVMDSIRLESGEMERKIEVLDRQILCQVLSDSYIPDLADQVLQELELNIKENRNSQSQTIDETSDVFNSEILSESSDTTPEEDWSFGQLFKSVLTDEMVNEDRLTNEIMEQIDLHSRSTDNSVVDISDSSTNIALLKALESELNTTLDEIAVDEVSTAPSSMSFEHEIPSPVIAQKDLEALEFDQSGLIEFTEEEEFIQEVVNREVSAHEEDSDEEVCLVEEGFVTEEMLDEQDSQFESLHSVLLAGASVEIDVWSAIVHKVTQPPLRLLRDTEDIEVVGKVPGVTKEQANVSTSPDSAANVEFLNSKSIDADSTISKVSITVLGSFLAVAAAWIIIVLPSLLTQTTSTINTPKRIVTFEVAEVNELEVEDLEVGDDMNVQILQGDANAPTIIFLDDLEAL